MANIQRQAHARWMGELLKGTGSVSTASGILREVPYSVPSRFEQAKGTNPEELLAAAHAACFSMMLSKVLGDMKIVPAEIQTTASLTMAQRDGGWQVTAIHLLTSVRGEGLTQETVQKAAQQAKDQCPVSVLLKPGLEQITMEARLAGGA